MTRYTEHFSTRETPQTEQADTRQVVNNAGGFTFAIDNWKRLERFLILGADGGTYYVGERELTIENAKCVQACLDEDGPRAVELIATISEAGRAPKNDPAIFALAIAAGHKDIVTRRAALHAVNRVCRIATHLFQFAESVEKFRGWGRSLRAAIANWYASRSEQEVSYQVAKYTQRGNWSHRDLFRLAHVDPKYGPVYRYIVSGADGLGDREVKRARGDERAPRLYPGHGELPEYLAAFEQLKKTRDEKTACELIRKHRFTHEMVPSELKTSVSVWEALCQQMPMTATIRTLGRLTSIGLLKPMGDTTRLVVERIANAEAVRKARVHPIAILAALRVYQQGHGEKGKLSWQPVPQIIDALDSAFYSAFEAIEPTGKRTMLALDVSGSMGMGSVSGCPGLTPRDASAAMAMVTARTERDWCVMGFSSRFIPLNISPKQRLDDVIRVISGLPFESTDCSLPMTWAQSSGIEIECFNVYTDNETFFGSIHPHQALRQYREKRNIAAKLAVIATTSTEFTIADPSDSGMIDFVGFDSATPNLLADFARD